MKPSAPLSSGESRRRASADLAAGLVPTAAVSVLTWRLFGPEAMYVAHCLALYAALATLLLWSAPPRLPGDSGLGPANRVTLGRAALVVPLAGLVLHPGALAAPLLWWVVLLGTVAMILDGLDGRVARRTGTHSAFGARFDMELDAFLLLALSVLVWQTGKVGAWVILIGGLRYLFVVGGWTMPALRAELPPSRRRKVVCVVQGVALLVCLGPIIPGPLAVFAAGAGLASLVYSFGLDVGWAVREGATGRGPSGGSSRPSSPHGRRTPP